MKKVNKKIISIISAFLFSIVLWGSVTLSNSYFTTIRVPVRLINLPKGYTVSLVTLKDVTIRLKGEGWRLAALSLGKNDDYLVSAGLGLDNGGKFIKLTDALVENSWLTSGIQVFDIYPDTLTLRLDRIREKRVKIYPVLNLDFRQNYSRVTGLKVIPDSITIYGARNLLKNIDSIPTLLGEFHNLDENFSEKLELRQIDGLGYSRNSCVIRFGVQKIVDKLFEGLNIEVLNVPSGQELILYPNKINITVRGGINLLGKLKDSDVRPIVDFNQVLSDSLNFIEPAVKLPDYTFVIDKKPNTVKYIIKKF